MAIQPDTTTGTLTTTSGSVNFTTVGTQLLAREHLPGDRFLVNGLELQIATITGENAGTLTEPCPPEAAVSGFPVRLRWQPDGARVAAQTRNLIDLLGNGTLQSLAGIDGNADELLIFIGPNTLSTINRLDLIEGVDYNVQVNTLPERAAYDAEAAGFSVLVSDVGDGRAALYIKKSATSGDWSAPAYLTGPVGPMPTILAGTTSTLTPGTPATVSVTPGVNTYSINIGVPQGFQGVPGVDGATGPQGSGLEIGALGDLANRDNYDSEAEGFTYFDTENGDLYIREGATGNWAGPIPFQGPPGTSGALITVTDGVGNTTPGPYTLNAAPFDVNSVWVSVSGIEQYDYIISGNLITFGFPIAAGVPWRVKTSGPLPVGVPSDDSVGAAQINGADADAIRTKIGAGDVVGPSSSLNNTLPVFDGTTGKLIKDSGILIADVGTGDVVGPASSTANRLAVFDGTTGKLIKEATALTPAQQGRARADIAGELLAGSRNGIINGDFQIWQRAATQTTAGYGSDDRWANQNSGSTKTHFIQYFTPGQTDVPGNPKHFSRTNVTSVTGASNFVHKNQPIEDVTKYAGKKITVTFHARSDSNRTIAVEFNQVFGTGGSPSASVLAIAPRKVAVNTSWQKISFTVDVPSIAGKTLGTNLNDAFYIIFWFDAGSGFNSRTDSLGHQSGTFDIAHVSIVEGDATAEADPFSPRLIGEEWNLCQRYFAYIGFPAGFMDAYSPVSGTYNNNIMMLPTRMRAAPSVVQQWNTGSEGNLVSKNMIASVTHLMLETRSVAVGRFFATPQGVLLDAEL